MKFKSKIRSRCSSFYLGLTSRSRVFIYMELQGTAVVIISAINSFLDKALSFSLSLFLSSINSLNYSPALRGVEGLQVRAINIPAMPVRVNVTQGKTAYGLTSTDDGRTNGLTYCDLVPPVLDDVLSPDLSQLIPGITGTRRQC